MDAIPDALARAGPLLVVAIVIAVGIASGALARMARLPGITGQILAGVLMGSAGFSLFPKAALEGLVPLLELALGLIAVTVGAHLNLRRLRNAGRRLFLLLLAEATITPLLVYGVMRLLGGATPDMSALFAAVSIATAPATVVALVRETRARGVFVKTLVAAVALNNMACIVLFELARAAYKTSDAVGGSLRAGVGDSLAQLAVAALVGAALAFAMALTSRLASRSDRLATAAVVALVAGVGISKVLDVSPLLTCLVMGFVQTNITRARTHLVDAVFADFEPAILAVFFTLAGMHLSFEHAGLAGLSGLLLFVARGAGKVLSARVAMRLAGATEALRLNLGLALIPQAGVAVGLVLLVQEDAQFDPVAGFFSAVVLTVVTVNEIVGPIFTRVALERAGEVGRDRLRLIDFLQEEHIVTNFRAGSQAEAIERLIDLLMRTHEVGVTRQELVDSVFAREAEQSTCLGGGLAVPHGILPEGAAMAGVMALSREGLDFETPDGRPVHCMVLLATADEERDRHLQVLATLARTVGLDDAFQAQLFDARTAAQAYELLHGEASEDFNYFLED